MSGIGYYKKTTTCKAQRNKGICGVGKCIDKFSMLTLIDTCVNQRGYTFFSI
jgi:hypothetical protein